MRRGFTLVELMVVIGIMAIMGSLSIAGYRQMKRGMEERSVKQNVESFIKGAIQRAQIDRQSVAVCFWNETLKGSTDDGYEVVVGRAVAVRRSGRISKVDGRYLCDEFGDLEFRNETFTSELKDGPSYSPSNNNGSRINMYRMSEDGEVEKSVVYEATEKYLSFKVNLVHAEKKEDIDWCYAFKKESGDWQVGDAYGFEFADITLPHGYIFGSDYSSRAESPIKGEVTYYIKKDGTSSGSVPVVNSLRPGSGGVLSPKSIGNINISAGSK